MKGELRGIRLAIFVGLPVLMVAGIFYRFHFHGSGLRAAHPAPLVDNPSGALQALNAWAEQRNYGREGTPSDGFYRAFEYVRELEAAGEENFRAPDPWESIGPANRGGRTNALAVDPSNPNVVYAGGASGGLWKMTQDGNDYEWEYMDTGHPVLGVMAIAVHPTNPDILYIGTGEVYQYGNSIGGLYLRSTRGSYGIGLLQTRDGGETWTKGIDWAYNQERGVLSLEMHPDNPDIVFAGTTEGVYRTLDGGANWQPVHDALMAVDIAINPEDPELVFASCGNQGSDGAGIYRSMTGGDPGSWEKLGGGLPNSWSGKTLLDIYQADPDIIYADVANSSSTIGLFRSEDNGETWTNLNSQNIASYQGWFAHYVRVHPEDNSRILMAGVNFYSSSNGGNSFNTRSGMWVDHHCFANHPTNPEIVYFGNDGGVYRSNNGGESFQSRNTGYVTTQFYNGFSTSLTDPELAAGGIQDGDCWIYRGRPNWDRLGCGGDGTYTAINPLDNNTIYASSQNLSIRISRNGGQSMSSIQNGLNDGRSAFVAPFVLAPTAPNILYGGKSYLYKTVNEGNSWQKMNGGEELNGNPILALGVSPTNEDVIYAATAPGGNRRARVYASIDGGNTLRDVTGDLPDRYYIDVVVSPHNESVVYLTLAGYGTSHLYRSPDGGSTWQDVGQGLPDLPALAFAEDPDHEGILYVGTDIGVFASVDNGQSWYPYKTGMPTAAMVMDLSISPSNRRLRAVTHGNGVWERDLLDPGDVSIRRDIRMAKGFWSSPGTVTEYASLQFDLERDAFISLYIYSIEGKRVRRLESGRLPAGRHTRQWNGRVAPGKYIARLKIGSATEKTLTLVVQ